MRQAIPFGTNKTPLAAALVLCGFEVVKFSNTYTPDLLQRLGEKSVKSAREHGKPGHIVWAFSGEGIADALKAWDDQQDRCKAGETFDVEQFAHEGERCQEMRRICFILHTRNAVAALWKTAPATLEEHHGSVTREKTGEGETVTFPRMTFASENLNRESRERLQV